MGFGVFMCRRYCADRSTFSRAQLLPVTAPQHSSFPNSQRIKGSTVTERDSSEPYR